MRTTNNYIYKKNCIELMRHREIYINMLKNACTEKEFTSKIIDGFERKVH